MGDVSLADLGSIPLLRERVYSVLLEGILTGALKPGTWIRERQIAAELGISTTPVKEAIRQLESHGMVVHAPRRGACVSDAALTSIKEIVEIRAHLEGMAARLAAEKLDGAGRARLDVMAEELKAAPAGAVRADQVNSRFHMLIRELSYNRFVVEFATLLEVFDLNVRRAALEDAEERQRGLEEHLAINAAVRDGRGRVSEQLMQDHIMRSGVFVLDKAQRCSGLTDFRLAAAAEG